jgi:hypothetical protein
MNLEAVDPACISHWDTRSGSLLKRNAIAFTGHQRWASFSHDGRNIAFANREGTITLSLTRQPETMRKYLPWA